MITFENSLWNMMSNHKGRKIHGVKYSVSYKLLYEGVTHKIYKHFFLKHTFYLWKVRGVIVKAFRSSSNKDSGKQYLEPVLNRGKMYLLCVDHCRNRQKKPVSKQLCRERLTEENVACYAPKRDQCWHYIYEQLKDEDSKISKWVWASCT